MGKATFFEVLLKDDESGRKCDLSKMLGRMDPEMATEVRDAMAAPEITAAAIARTLQRFDFPVTEGSIRRCRRICDCWKVT